MTIQQLYLTELKKKPNYNERKNNSVVMRKNDRNWKNLGSINVATPGIEYWCLCYQSCGFFSIEGLLIGLHSTGHYDLLVHWPMGGKVQCKLFSVLHTLCQQFLPRGAWSNSRGDGRHEQEKINIKTSSILSIMPVLKAPALSMILNNNVWHH